MKRTIDQDNIEELAFKLSEKINTYISKLNWPEEFFRRDFDGVSCSTFLLKKMIAEILVDGKPDLEGLEKCKE